MSEVPYFLRGTSYSLPTNSAQTELYSASAFVNGDLSVLTLQTELYSASNGDLCVLTQSKSNYTLPPPL